MRRKILEALAMLSMASCSTIDMFEPVGTLGTGLSRNTVLVSKNGRKEHGDPGGGNGAGFRKDTALYISVLEFPKSYDWRKDSAYLRSGAEVVLYRNGERVLKLPTGPADDIGTGADMHHIVEGHLVTEYYGSHGTVVKLDGKEVFRSSQPEVLRGLLMDGEELVSLTQKRDGKGFVYRKGKTVLMERSNGDLIGALGDDTYFTSGALAMDNRSICFAYRLPDGAVFVEDGNERAVACNGDLIDIRRIEGNHCILEREGDHLRFSVGDRSRAIGSSYNMIRNGCHISVIGDEPAALCLLDNRYGSSTTEVQMVDRAVRILMGIHTIVPCDGGFGYVSHDPSSRIEITGNEGNASRNEGAYLWMGAKACCSIGGQIIVGATPYSTGGFPEVIRDGKKESLEVNGFVTGVSCVINHPS